VVTVLGYETLGHRHLEDALRRMRAATRRAPRPTEG
jgi:hypothetical protein